MSIPADVVGIWAVLLLVWLLSKCRRGERPPPVELLPPPPAPLKDQARWLRTCQAIAQERADWRMADYYRDYANRLDAQAETDRQADNRALRTRIVGADRAKDFE